MSIYVTDGDCALIMRRDKAKETKVAILQILGDEPVKLVKIGENEKDVQYSIELLEDGFAPCIWPAGDRNVSLDRQICKILALCEQGSFISFYEQEENLCVQYAKQPVGLVRERCEYWYFDDGEDFDEEDFDE